MDWIIENKEWLFSGIGLTTISFIVGLFLKKKNRKTKDNQQVINSGNNSTNIQSGRDVHVTFGENRDR
ncbi:hypothetical protein [Niallia sp. MER TA 168]|uniref:hypothetical protein n=1 Tax=Niallia sp. MER TA 168 TaxID=2939568 RepID=UPI00203C8753|nr:hypothetical protein [Niallia sp. MER TA 168]MCM3363000.1 hypothetical protein [Niallia sp. MER TA 168]